jgi:hypothetical protein
MSWKISAPERDTLCILCSGRLSTVSNQIVLSGVTVGLICSSEWGDEECTHNFAKQTPSVSEDYRNMTAVLRRILHKFGYDGEKDWSRSS